MGGGQSAGGGGGTEILTQRLALTHLSVIRVSGAPWELGARSAGSGGSLGVGCRRQLGANGCQTGRDVRGIVMRKKGCLLQLAERRNHSLGAEEENSPAG